MKVNMRTSPVDKIGNRRLLHFHKIFNGWNSNLVQPDLKISLEEDPEVATAYFTVHYSKNSYILTISENEWKNVYSFNDMTPAEIEESLTNYGIYLYDHMNNLMEDEDYEMTAFKF
jgi:hypothetical protein